MEIKVHTLNTSLSPLLAPNQPTERVKRIVDTAKEQRPSIILLQEVFNTRYRRELCKHLSRLGYTFRLNEKPTFYRTNGGLFTFSRLSIRDSHFQIFDNQSGHLDEGWPWEKGFESMTVEIGEQPIKVINTHLAHRERDQAVRIAQIKEILQSTKDDCDVILGGDLNMRKIMDGEKSSEYRIVEDAGFQDTLCDYVDELDFATFPRTNERLDYVFVRSRNGRLRPRYSEIIKNQLSDHCVYEAVIKID